MNDQEWSEQQPQAVIVTGIHVPFWSVVGFMVKWSIASILALFILALIELVLTALFWAIFIHYSAPGTLTSFFMGLYRAFVPAAQ